jgi:hypothetical protein
MVDYSRLLKSPLFMSEYIASVAQLKSVDLGQLKNDDEKLSFFISILLFGEFSVDLHHQSVIRYIGQNKKIFSFFFES